MNTIRVACLLCVMAWIAPVSADDIFWDGGGVDNKWDTAITGGTVEWHTTDLTSDVFIGGGSVTWNSGSHTFRADYTRTRGPRHVGVLPWQGLL